MDPVTRSRPARVIDGVYLACQLLAAGLLLAFIIGSLLLTGGQVLENGHRIYDQVWGWPVFPVPAWLLIIPAAFSAAVVVPLVLTTRIEDAQGLIGRWGQTIVAVVAGLTFATAFPASTGVWPLPDGSPAQYFGLHWVAAALSAFCFVVILLGMLIKLPAHERLRKAGKLPTANL